MIKELREYYSKQYYKEQEKIKELFDNKEYDSIKDSIHTITLSKEIELSIQGLTIDEAIGCLREAKNTIPDNSICNEVYAPYCDEIILQYEIVELNLIPFEKSYLHEDIEMTLTHYLNSGRAKMYIDKYNEIKDFKKGVSTTIKVTLWY